MIGVLIPAFNAEATVERAAFGAIPHADRVLVVDDGSCDGTSAGAARAGVEVIHHEVNRGKGAALATGFMRLLAEGAEAVVTMDADLQHEPDDIPCLVEAYRVMKADLVIGSRERGFDKMTPGRRFGNRFSCGALRFFAGLDLPDSQSGFRLYGAEFLRDLPLTRQAYDAEIEALLIAARRRRRIVTLPITVRDPDGRATSNFRPWLDTYRICRTVVQFSVCTY